MKNLISFLLIFSLSAPIMAAGNCVQILSDNHSNDSRSYQVYDMDLEKDFDESPEEYSLEALNSLLSRLGCDSMSQKDEGEVVCKEIMPGNNFSKVCYLENELGYFFISKDMLDSVNIIYNRWD
ncbi:hypothetical protein [Halobacteriovorax sp. HLS]|uniref:hypothetical protein n=1 Tax=Halobacteriovorax sp. HLS TaxID=2234000 RepID=UPI000FD7E1AD|nr:hypothetical protein [Halobacteriovorax sp. HLS]